MSCVTFHCQVRLKLLYSIPVDSNLHFLWRNILFHCQYKDFGSLFLNSSLFYPPVSTFFPECDSFPSVPGKAGTICVRLNVVADKKGWAETTLDVQSYHVHHCCMKRQRSASAVAISKESRVAFSSAPPHYSHGGGRGGGRSSGGVREEGRGEKGEERTGPGFFQRLLLILLFREAGHSKETATSEFRQVFTGAWVLE